MPANRPNSLRPQAPRTGPDTAQYGRVWPNQWPNGDLQHDIERRGVAPACRCGRLMRHCPADGRTVALGTRSRGRPDAGGEARACRSWRPRVAGSGRALTLRPIRAASETSRVGRRPLPSSKQQSRPEPLLVVHCGRDRLGRVDARITRGSSVGAARVPTPCLASCGMSCTSSTGMTGVGDDTTVKPVTGPRERLTCAQGLARGRSIGLRRVRSRR
jgi:hypothetical protein